MKKIIDGNEACANKAYLFSEISAIYPITPSSPMAAKIDELSYTDKKNIFYDSVSVIEMQSEAGAAGMMHGSLQSGLLSSTFTSSQGLLLMLPNMYKMAGEMLPAVIHVASRSIATHALSIFGDHQDIYAARATGFCILSSCNVQDASNLAAVTHLSAIRGSMPFIHFFDGFRTSHEINTIEEIPDEELLKLVDHEAIKRFREKSINLSNKNSRGMAENEDIYFQSTEARNKNYNDIVPIVEYYMNQINSLTNSNYAPFVYYGDENAKNIIVAMGSICDTIKNVIDEANKNGEKLGLITVHLYRPFSEEYFLKVLPKSVENIAVLDRTKEAGSNGEPLYLDVCSIVSKLNINVYGGRFGLSSKNTDISDIYSVYEMLNNNPRHNFTIGIEDDITNLSLPKTNFKINNEYQEILIYGFGSDGMVSASKDILKIIGEEKQLFAQGYFEYDSKKSNGITISNLRFNHHKIRAPYYVTEPSTIIVTKDNYLRMFDCLSKIKQNGTFILNTSKTIEQLNDFLPYLVKKQLMEKNVKLLIIAADEIAAKHGISGKINTIMQVLLLKMMGIEDYQNIMKERLTERFITKGQDVVDANINVLDEALNNIIEVPLNFTLTEEENKPKNIFEIINSREGNNLKVSEVLDIKEGIFPGALSKKEKRNLSPLISTWDKEKCIECGLCSFVCPHAVIRPFIFDADNKYAPYARDEKANTGKKFYIAISGADCTGCAQCMTACPTKALSYGEFSQEKQLIANDLFNNYQNPDTDNKFSVKGSQLIKPKFEFSGACAGCGETPYIKLLTQLYGDELIIANATGCSSIYGGSAPSTPYSIPWSNSLFEDNAEYGLGLYYGQKKLRNRLKNIMENSIEAVDLDTKELFNTWLNNMNNYEITAKVSKDILTKEIPQEIKTLSAYLPASSIWCIGGDGWAYDIGFGGIDHVLSSNENIKILVLDTEVYSNTGGQASKSSGLGQVAQFADFGKKTNKKDLFKIAMTYPNVYVASIALGANYMQTIKVFKEAKEHNGPSIIIAYSPCLEHGIKGGLGKGIDAEKLAVKSGYSLLMRYNPNEEKLYLDSPAPDFNLYNDFLDSEVRYRSLKLKDENLAKELYEQNKIAAQKRYDYYSSLAKN